MISPGTRLLAEVVNDIIANPQICEQSVYHSGCGTSRCIVGWGQRRSGKPADAEMAHYNAWRAYELSGADADWLFAGERSLGEIRHFAETKLVGLDRDGYDRDGYDHDGYDHDGYDRDSYDCNGYDPDGYNYDGYDRDGRPLPLLVIPAE